MKELKVKINDVYYYPAGVTSDSSKPFDEPGVNYRALVNDKLEELGTYTETVKSDSDEDLCLATTTHANDDWFIIAGRVQEILKNKAYYNGGHTYYSEGCTSIMALSLQDGYTWEQVYDLLINEDNEHIIETGERS